MPDNVYAGRMREGIEKLREARDMKTFHEACRGLQEHMKIKKLTEEIAADMVHYSAQNLYFFLYDKEKIIENPSVFKETYEKKIKDKRIYIIIHQPKTL